MSSGAFSDAETRLAALTSTAATPQVLLALAKTKEVLLGQLAQDVRFQSAWEQKRAQLVEVLDQIGQISPGSQEAAEANSMRAKLTQASVSKPPSGCATLVLTAIAVVVAFIVVAAI